MTTMHESVLLCLGADAANRPHYAMAASTRDCSCNRNLDQRQEGHVKLSAYLLLVFGLS